MSQHRTSDEIYARGVAWNAINSGKIKRPDACSNCGRVKPLDAHHDDYSKPLEVRFLCRSCHMRFDGRAFKLKGPKPKPARACRNCGRIYKPMRHDRCDPCASFWKLYGIERPYTEATTHTDKLQFNLKHGFRGMGRGRKCASK